MLHPFVRKLRHGAGLTSDDEDAFTQLIGTVHRIGARHDIVGEEERGAALPLIVDGWACRYRDLPDGRRQIIAFFLPGDLCEPFGVLPLVMDYSLASITPVEFVRVPMGPVRRLAQSSAAAEKALWWDLLVSSSILHERAVSLGRRTAFERLGHLLCELQARLALVGLADEHGYALPVTQRDLADALGITDVHLNRSLQALRATGLVSLSGRRLIIHDLASLRAASLFDLGFLHLHGTSLA